MGDESSRGPVMTKICWWLVDRVSRTLESDERQAVLGDLAESGETAGRALFDVLSLVVRRQAALWMHWRPWLALVGLIVPLGMLLSVASRRIADGSAIYLWLYANNWDWAYWHNPGFRHDFAHNIGFILLEYFTLVCWSWAGGFLLGRASRGIVQVNRALFGLMLSFGALLGAPLYFDYYSQYLHRVFSRLPPDPNSAVFAVGFYRLMLPLIVQAVLVLVPALWAMRYGTGVAKLRPLVRTVSLAAAIATLAAIVLQNPTLFLFQSPYRPPRFWQSLFWQKLIAPHEGLGPLVWLLHAVVYWPVVYVVASAIGRRLRNRTAIA
jgi:hypothetical protein